MFKDLINERFINEILSVITVYGPLSKKEIAEYLIEYYQHSLLDSEMEEMDIYLESLLAVNRLFLINNKYSSLTQDTIKQAKKELKDIVLAVKGLEKKYEKDELIKYANVDKLIGIKEFDNLKKYYNSLTFKDKSLKDELFLALCFGLYSCFDINDVIKELKDNTNNLNEKKLTEYLTDYSAILPRPFLNGFTYEDINNMEDELEKNLEDVIKEEMLNKNIDEFYSKNNKIQGKINKKAYGEFSYSECMELIKKVNKSEIYKLVDSDKVLELLINNKPVYIEILGYYNNDKAILIYRSKEEMNNTHSLMIGDYIDEYPDFTMHVSCIEVSNEGTDFLNDKMIDELNKKKIPLEPNISVLEGYKGLRLPNQEELNLVGSVLSDIIKLLQLSNLSEIKLNLGESEDMFDIYQVYVGDDEIRYGKYNDIDKGDITLDFKLNQTNKKLINNLKKYKKRDILIGTYILNSYIEEFQEFPHMILVVDKETELVYHAFLKPTKDIRDIKNEILKLFNELKIRPNCIYVNNEYSYEFFDEFDEYYKVDFDEEGILNNIYNMFLEEGDKFDEEQTFVS